ncbi:MAG: nicotinate-nucleotide adenylyltransferase [Mobilitalea sp.]
MKKVGIMGGTFNPIHYGHLFLAEYAYDQIGLDQILFMPSKNPPHKVKPEDITDQQRSDMISLAITDNPHFELSSMELEREGMTYTADTLSILIKEHPNTKYYFIVGADSLFMMQNWMDPQTIFNLCTIVAASRDNVEKEKLQNHAEYLERVFSANILLLDMPTIQIASAVIRDRVVTNKSTRYYLPEAINLYIAENRLYQTKLEDLQ